MTPTNSIAVMTSLKRRAGGQIKLFWLLNHGESFRFRQTRIPYGFWIWARKYIFGMEFSCFIFHFWQCELGIKQWVKEQESRGKEALRSGKTEYFSYECRCLSCFTRAKIIPKPMIFNKRIVTQKIFVHQSLLFGFISGRIDSFSWASWLFSDSSILKYTDFSNGAGFSQRLRAKDFKRTRIVASGILRDSDFVL